MDRGCKADTNFAPFWWSHIVIDEDLVCLVDQDDSVLVTDMISFLHTDNSYEFSILTHECSFYLVPGVFILIQKEFVWPHDDNFYRFYVLFQQGQGSSHRDAGLTLARRNDCYLMLLGSGLPRHRCFRA